MTREEFRDYVDFLRSQDEISYDVYSGLIDGIDTLEQQPCEDEYIKVHKKALKYRTERMVAYIDRQAAIDAFERFIHELGIDDEPYNYGEMALSAKNVPPVTVEQKPQPKMGQWILTQRGKYIDINCSECGNTRLKDYAYGYTIDEIDLNGVNELIVKNHLNYCECCGAKMSDLQKRRNEEM